MPHVVEDELRKRGVRNVTVSAWSAQNRTDAFSALRARAYTDRIGLYDDGVLVSELLRLRTQYRAGAAQVVTPRTANSHCDEAIALACAVYAHDKSAVSRIPWPTGWRPTNEPAITRDLADRGPGFVRADPTRSKKWYDRPSESILDREF
jgi:hypothetical protein